MCNELGLSNIESLSVSKVIVGSFTIEQWTDMEKPEFIQKSKFITVHEKSILAKHLKKCEELLR